MGRSSRPECSPVLGSSGPNNSSSVAVGDFNGDGMSDLVVAKASTSIVSILLGNGDSTFQAARAVVGTPNSQYRSVTVSDLNGDRLTDLVMANSFSSNVHVLLGNGDGTFQAVRAFSAFTLARFATVGDFNRDGVPDLAITSWDSFVASALSVRLGNGDGTFQAATHYAAGSRPTSLSAGDFTGDGVVDLAVANRTSHNVAVLPGNGDGTFRAALFFGSDPGPTSLAVGDFNHDGKSDLAVATGPGVSVLINNTPTYDLAVSREGNGSGTVTSTSTPASAQQVDCGTSCSATYYGGTQVTLTASAGVGSTFAGWTGCDTVSDTRCRVTMSEAKSVAATFTLQRFTLTVTKDGIGRGTVTSSSDPGSSTPIDCGTTCSASFDWGTVVTLTATPGFANRFFGWSGCDAASGTTCTITIRAAGAVTATFHGLPFDLPPRLGFRRIERIVAWLSEIHP